MSKTKIRLETWHSLKDFILSSNFHARCANSYQEMKYKVPLLPLSPAALLHVSMTQAHHQSSLFFPSLGVGGQMQPGVDSTITVTKVFPIWWLIY